MGKLKGFPVFTEKNFDVLKSAVNVYGSNSDEIKKQARDDFDRVMLKVLDSFIFPGELEKRTKSELEKQKGVLPEEYERQMKEIREKLKAESGKMALLEKQNAALMRSEERLRHALSDVYGSSSWKVGNLLVRPFHWIKEKLKNR